MKEWQRGNLAKKYGGRGGEEEEVPGRESIMKKGKNQHCVCTHTSMLVSADC